MDFSECVDSNGDTIENVETFYFMELVRDNNGQTPLDPEFNPLNKLEIEPQIGCFLYADAYVAADLNQASTVLS